MSEDFDPYDPPTSRDELVTGRRWRSVVRETIFAIHPGDEVIVETWRKDVDEKRLTIVEHKRGDLLAVTTDGEEFLIVPSYSYQERVGRPWLRTLHGYESRGRIDALEVTEIGDWE